MICELCVLFSFRRWVIDWDTAGDKGHRKQSHTEDATGRPLEGDVDLCDPLVGAGYACAAAVCVVSSVLVQMVGGHVPGQPVQTC